MLQRHLIHITIERPVAAVYEFLAEPLNYPMWSAVVPGTYRQVGPLEWAAETEFGPRLVRFCPRNTFGVLDHGWYREGDEPLIMPMRVVANGEGTELIVLFYRRPELDDETFASTIEWVTVDFLVLKGLLEEDPQA
jgi:hypothetical protein